MAHCLHHVNVVAYPVFIGHYNFAIYKNKAPVGKNITSQIVDKKSETWVLRGKNRGKPQFSVVIGAAIDTVYSHSWELVLKFDHF
jgi:hypothetical protein